MPEEHKIEPSPSGGFIAFWRMDVPCFYFPSSNFANRQCRPLSPLCDKSQAR
jgi:hypothetical protein